MVCVVEMDYSGSVFQENLTDNCFFIVNALGTSSGIKTYFGKSS